MGGTRPLALALVAVSVLTTVLVYPPTAAWPLALVWLAPVVAALDGARPLRGFALAYVYSVAMALVVGRWLVHALATEYGVPLAAAWSFTVLLVCAYAVIPAGAAALHLRLAARAGDVLAPLVFAALWIAGEWLRAEPGGLPWLLAAHTVVALPLVLQTADLGGVYAVGFAVVAMNAGLGLAFARRRPAPLAAPALVLLLSLGYGGWRLGAVGPPSEPLRVGVVQASVPQAERFQAESAERNVHLHIALTRGLAAREPLDLVVWSETAVDTDLDRAPGLRSRLEQLAAEIRVPLVTGAPRSREGRRTNSVVVVDPRRGLAASYDKQRLVPFSEYDPPLFSWLAPLLGPVSEGDPYAAGRGPTLLPAAGTRLAAPVCFEITYPHLVRRFRAAGADLLVNLSNDAWFGRTGYAEMHFLHTRLRAVELRTWVVRGANTGISAIVDPGGRVVESLPAFAEGTLRGSVGAAGPAPFYARAGDGPILLLLAALVLGSLLAPRGSGR